MSVLTGVLVQFCCVWRRLCHSARDFGYCFELCADDSSLVAGVPGVALALLDHGLGTSIGVAIGYVVINVGISNGLNRGSWGNVLAFRHW